MLAKVVDNKYFTFFLIILNTLKWRLLEGKLIHSISRDPQSLIFLLLL